jgi:hypothetical protein
MKQFAALFGLLFVSSALDAQLPAVGERPKPLTDPLLDNLVGDWHVTRKSSDGRTSESSLHVEWVLNHQFLELHYRALVSPPEFEAKIFIGLDPKSQHYIMHWLDIMGGPASKILATGTLDEAAHTIYFQWSYPDSQLINAFAFDPASKTWVSVIRQKTKGPWILLAEDKITKR